MLSDHVYYAAVFDGIVGADRRGEGNGEELLEALLDHPSLKSVDGFSPLRRRELVPFYEPVGLESFDPEIEIPDGGAEELERMAHERDGEPATVVPPTPVHSPGMNRADARGSRAGSRRKRL